MKKYIFLLIVLSVSGCAFNRPPSSSLIDSVPVIKVGEYTIVPSDYIVFIPANTESPVNFSAKGTVFKEDIGSTVMATFKKDMYLYKYWDSLDGKKWVNSHKLMSVEPSEGFDNTGGKAEVELNLSN